MCPLNLNVTKKEQSPFQFRDLENLFHFHDDNPGYFQTFVPITLDCLLSHHLKSDVSWNIYILKHKYTQGYHNMYIVFPLTLVIFLSSAKFWACQISSRADLLCQEWQWQRTRWKWGEHTPVSHHVHPMSPEVMDLIPSFFLQRWCSRRYKEVMRFAAG